MATVAAPPLPQQQAVQQQAVLDAARPRATTLDWGNSAPLALSAFAVTTLMLGLALDELCESSYGRSLLPVWPLSKR